MAWRLLAAFFAVQQVCCSGLFEFQLPSFRYNDSEEVCCSGFNVTCSVPCGAVLHVCLKHYQAQVDTVSPCTFGEETVRDDFNSSVQLPFTFAWPGTFSLIIDVKREEKLLAHVALQHWLEASTAWSEEERHLQHSVIRYAFRATCSQHYYGPRCATLCRPRNDLFGHSECSTMGDRVCLPGWGGPYCNIPMCASWCQGRRGHCVHPGLCRCSPGWRGLHCDECLRYPGCAHGSCLQPWDCLCDAGWGGLLCDQDLNPCEKHNPCQNEGTCISTAPGTYTCNCAPGFTGSDCNVTHCASSPCLLGGSCEVVEGGYRCLCPPGVEGSNCDKDALTCNVTSCLNGGSCIHFDDYFKCTCPLGYSGDLCETPTCSGRNCISRSPQCEIIVSVALPTLLLLSVFLLVAFLSRQQMQQSCSNSGLVTGTAAK